MIWVGSSLTRYVLVTRLSHQLRKNVLIELLWSCWMVLIDHNQILINFSIILVWVNSFFLRRSEAGFAVWFHFVVILSFYFHHLTFVYLLYFVLFFLVGKMFFAPYPTPVQVLCVLFAWFGCNRLPDLVFKRISTDTRLFWICAAFLTNALHFSSFYFFLHSVYTLS